MQILEQFQEPLGLLLRWSHLLAAITALGGLIFSRFALLPALEDLDEEARARVHNGIRRSWMKWVMGSITILLVTGLANYLLTINRANTEAWGGEWSDVDEGSRLPRLHGGQDPLRFRPLLSRQRPHRPRRGDAVGSR